MNMNRILVLSVFTLTLILSACSGTDDEVASTEAVSDSEASDLEKENEALRKELAEKENKELKAELEAAEEENSDEQSDEKIKKDSNSKKEKNESDTEDTQTANRAELYFDLSDESVKNQFIGTEYGNEDGSFEQNAITKGMSQTEVEEKYGAYDFTAYASGSAPAYYGNLAVVYSEYAPYGTDGEPARTDIDPDTNYVESVFYYAGISPDEMISILGEPDDYNDGGLSHNGLPYYVYHGEGTDGRYYSTGAGTYDFPEGHIINIMKREIFEKDPSDENAESASVESVDAEYIEAYMKNYISALADYYNGDSRDARNYVTGNALSKIDENQASGYFADHEDLGVIVLDIAEISSDTYSVTIERDYSHANSSGSATTQVTYTITDDDGYMQITDFE